MVGEGQGVIDHDEVVVMMVSYMIQAVREGKRSVRIVSDDTDVFVLLVYWVRKVNICALVQMEKWNGTVIDINDTAASLGDKSLQLLRMHAITGCDTVSYPYNKGKIIALSTLCEGSFEELSTSVGEKTTMHEELLMTGQMFFASLYGIPKCKTMNDARHNLYIKKKGKPPHVKALPPTDDNLLHHMPRAHHQTML